MSEKIEKIKKSFIFYESFYDAIEHLPDKKRLKLFDAITKLALRNEEIELKDEEKRLFCLIKPQVLANLKRYNDGKKGGRPKKENIDKLITSGFENEKTSGFENGKPNKNKNVNKNENVNENENEEEKEKEIHKEKKSKSFSFNPPTICDVQEYVDEISSHIDANDFVDYYTMNGWKVGKNPMKDWRAAVRHWTRRKKTEQVKKPYYNPVEYGGLF